MFDFRGLIPALLTMGVLIGFILFVIIPWLYGIAKPFIHAITE